VPLAGVLWWGWDVWSIFVLYWIENGIVGVLNVPKILLARGESRPGRPFATVNGRPIGLVGRGGIAAFFCLHYGVFWVVHGAFVFAFLPLMTGVAGFELAGPFAGISADWGLILAAATGLAISHGGSFVLNYLGRREYRELSPAEVMAAPYGRVVILHVAILAGGWATLAIGAPLGALLGLVLFKTGADLAAHLREHRRIGPVSIPSAV